MSTDYGEKEREFLQSLKEHTGRDLGGWMAAISASGHMERNDIIDWLRQQGFMFSKASWLERIHHNAGKPIYGDKPAIKTAAPARPDKPLMVDPGPEPVAAEPDREPVPQATTAPAAPVPTEPPAAPATVTANDATEIEPLLAAAKAYRPLAQFLLREITRVVPDARLVPDGPHISIARDRPFALLAISPRELRLALNLGQKPIEAPFKPVKLTTPASRIPSGLAHMIILSDARQIDEALLGAIAEAALAGG